MEELESTKAILIVTWQGTTQLCLELLRSLEPYNDYPKVVAITEVEKCDDTEFLAYLREHDLEVLPIEGNRWECGGLQAMMAFKPYDEFILIQDTLEVKDPSIFNKMFEITGSVAFGSGWLCYLGKYRREILNQLTIPVCLTKADAFYQEIMFNFFYSSAATAIEGHPPIVMFPEWNNDNPQNYTEEKFGRKNLVLYNPYLIKRKSIEWFGIGPYAASIVAKVIKDAKC